MKIINSDLKNNNMTEKELIIGLIKDDLTNIRLVSGLEKLGINSSKYYLNISEIFFALIGIKDDEHRDELFKEYFKFAREVLVIDIFDHPELLTGMANEVFDKLMKEKNQNKS